MESLMNRLDQDVVLSSDELQNIKKAISMKYASSTYTRQQEIFQDHIGQLLDNGLKGLMPSYAFLIKTPIMRALWMGKRFTVTKGDLLRDILLLTLDRADLYSVVYQWLQSQEVRSVDFKELSELIRTAHSNTEDDEYRSKGLSDWLGYFNHILARLTTRAALMGFGIVFSLMVGVVVISAITGVIVFGDPEGDHWQDAIVQAESAQDLQMFNEIKLLNYYAVKNKNQTATANAEIQMSYKRLEEQAKARSVVNQKQVALLQEELKTNQLAKKKSTKPILVISVSQTRWIQLAYGKNTAPIGMDTIDLPNFMRYELFNQESLRQYLNQKNSILADPEYFNAILSASKAHDIDPRFLFAITGQEQSLVKRSNAQAAKIANNPFNIYNSWQKYNTNIEDSSDIVCNTIVNRMSKWDGTGDPIQWLNKTYAEDIQWHFGVRRYYELLVKATR